jgi:taurine dioxygenase
LFKTIASAPPGLHLDLSEALLNTLLEWIKKPESMLYFRWKQDAIAIWHHTAAQHRAVFGFAPHYRAGQRLTFDSFTPTKVPPPATRQMRRSGHVDPRPPAGRRVVRA